HLRVLPSRLRIDRGVRKQLAIERACVDHVCLLPESRARFVDDKNRPDTFAPLHAASAKPVLLRGQTSVYDQARACHEASIVRGEKHDSLRDVGGCTKPANRMSRQCGLSRRIDVVRAEIAGATDEGLFTHVGLNYTRMYRVDADTVPL